MQSAISTQDGKLCGDKGGLVLFRWP